jgi:hypothetical protein
MMKVIASLARGLMAALLVNAFAAAMPIWCFAQQNSALRAYPAGNWGTQTFLCQNGLPAGDCKNDFEILKSHLQAYPTAQLGVWTWVLVQSNHWKQLGGDLGLDSASPAYTAIEDRLTLIDESMLVQRDANRNAELIRKFDLPLSKLIDLAVTHEMAHALCGFKDEYKADAVGKRLREGELPYCSLPGKIHEKFPMTLQADVWGATHETSAAASK